MRKVTIPSALAACVVAIGTGCEGPVNTAAPVSQSRNPAPHRTTFDAANNPTAQADRGAPSLTDRFRLGSWIYVDGRDGAFVERDGKPQVEWVIDGSVSSSPTFRVEAYEPLLGTPRDFSCTLDTVESADGSTIAYSIKAVTGTFKTGHDYPLLHPGKDFVVRNRLTGDVVSEIAPLVRGQYMIAAGVKNLAASTEGVAITYFTVGDRG